MTRTLIVDISHHQPSNRINWAKAAEQVALMIIRVQYGSRLIDWEYKNHVANCKKHGIPFGHYAYALYKNNDEARQEARDFLARMDAEAKFLVVDVEEQTTKTREEMAPGAQVFINELKAAGIEKVGLYTGHHFYKPYGMDKVKADFLWIPRYGSNDGSPSRKPDYPCDLWQYTERGTVSWYSGHLDLNKINGDKSLEWFIGTEQKPSAAPATEKDEPKKGEPTAYMHVVVSGDTLSDIAVKYKTTVAALVKLNSIEDPNRIFPGQRLRLVSNVAPTAPASSKHHIVAKGENLTKIAQKHKVPLSNLKKLNPQIKNYDLIIPGQKIRVK